MNAAELISRHEKLKTGSKRTNFEALWNDAALYCLPTKAQMKSGLNQTSGAPVSTQVYDSTAMDSAQILAAALHSYLTNPASKWFGIRTRDRKDMQATDAKVWLKEVESISYDSLNSSNFGNQIHEAYLDLVGLGTTVLYSEEDAKDDVRYYCRPLEETILSEGGDERVDTVFREFKLTARQAFKRWGKESGTVVLEAIDKQDFEKEVTFIHATYPRHERDVAKKDNKNMPFASKYIEVTKKEQVSEGGYEEFPYFTPRFLKKSGDVYGYSPAIVSMPNIKMLNAMAKTLIRGAQKVVDPPVAIPHDGFLLPLNMDPAGVNYELQATGGETMRPIGNYGNIPIGLEMIQRLEGAIMKAFYVHIFLMSNAPQMNEGEKVTATQITAMEGEKMLILGPVLGRLMHELLNPLLQRHIAILARKGKLPKMPESLKDKEFIVEYVSPLAKAQKISEIQSLVALTNYVGALVQGGMQHAADKINVDKAIDNAGEVYGTAPDVIYDADAVEGIRKSRQEAQNKQELLVAAQGAGKAAKDLAGADKLAADAQGKNAA